MQKDSPSQPLLLNQFLPDYHFAERHQIIIPALVQAVYPAVRALDLSGSLPVRGLFRLRGLPASALTLEGLRRFSPFSEGRIRQSGVEL